MTEIDKQTEILELRALKDALVAQATATMRAGEPPLRVWRALLLAGLQLAIADRGAPSAADVLRDFAAELERDRSIFN